MENTVYKLSYFETYRDVFYGYDENGFYFIAIKSDDKGNNYYTQKSRELIFKYNVNSLVKIDDNETSMLLHLLKCTSLERKYIINFERLISAFLKTENYKLSDKISDLFSIFLTMFSVPKNRKYEDFEGFFSELYFIYYMRKNNCDIAKYWQSKSKMKFDFTFDIRRRLDVKSTSKANRIHHFKHEQLASDIYDIRIASLLIRTADQGLSINSLIERIREFGPLPLTCEKIIQSYISNTENSDELDDLLFDEMFVENNLKIYDATDIPKFNCKQPNGVTKTEYDSDLSNCNPLNFENLKGWI